MLVHPFVALMADGNERGNLCGIHSPPGEMVDLGSLLSAPWLFHPALRILFEEHISQLAVQKTDLLCLIALLFQVGFAHWRRGFLQSLLRFLFLRSIPFAELLVGAIAAVWIVTGHHTVQK